jgi:DNA modification methylase
VELLWPGKYDAQGVRAPVARPASVLDTVEVFAGDDEPDRLIVGDNLHAMNALAGELAGRIDLVYVDPPFATGGKFSVATRVGQGRDGKPPPEVEAPAYADRWDGGVDGFLAVLDPRLRLVHELLAPHGSFYLHCDPTVGHAVKLLLDEIFGPECFQREIVWRIGWISGFKSKARNWIRNHDLIFFYVKDPRRFTFNKIHVPYPEGYVRRDGQPPRGQGMPIDDVWNANDTEFALEGAESLDSIQIKSFSREKCGYATQKNESIARRIVEASSNPGDLVADFFCGSGTTGVAARRLHRRFVGCDWSGAAVHIAKKRLLGVPSPRGLSVERARAAAPMPAAEWVSLVAQHHGVQPSESAAVFVAPPAESVDPGRIETLWVETHAAGHAALRILARRFDLPLAHRCPPSVTLLRVLDDVLNPAVARERDAAVVELPTIDLRAELVEIAEPEGPGVVLTLAGYAFAHPERLSEALRAAVQQWSDLVDAWSVTWGPDPLLSRVRTDEIVYRTHHRRALSLRTAPHPLDGPRVQARVKIVDVLYQTTIVELAVERRGDALEIVHARRV